MSFSVREYEVFLLLHPQLEDDFLVVILLPVLITQQNCQHEFRANGCWGKRRLRDNFIPPSRS